MSDKSRSTAFNTHYGRKGIEAVEEMADLATECAEGTMVPFDAVYETVEDEYRGFASLAFIDQMKVLDTVTERWDVSDEYEPAQASEAPYGTEDWRSAVVGGYGFQLLQAAVSAELHRRGYTIE